MRPLNLTLVCTCSGDTKLPGRDGSVDVQLRAGSMYVMSGIARYGLKHGVLDASALGDRVSLTFREVTKKSAAGSGPPAGRSPGRWSGTRRSRLRVLPAVTRGASARARAAQLSVRRGAARPRRPS